MVKQLINQNNSANESIINNFANESTLSENFIMSEKLSFSFTNTWYLMIRSVKNSLRLQWIPLILQFIVVISTGILLAFMGNRTNGEIDGCVHVREDNSSYFSCADVLNSVKLEYRISQNLTYIFLMGAVVPFIQVVLSTITFSSEVCV